MLATRTARWTAMTVLVCLALVAACWFLLISPRRAQAAEINEQTDSLRAQNDVLELKVAELKAQYAQLPEKKAELAAVYAQLPASAAMPTLVRSFTELAAASGVTLTEVTPSAAVELAAPTPAAAATPAASPAATPAPAAPAPADGAAAPGAAPAAAATRIVQIPVTMTVDGDYFETVAFLKRLQTELPRVYLVTSLKVSSAEVAGGDVTLTIGGNIYALPDVDRSVAAAGPGAVTSDGTAPAVADPAGPVGGTGSSGSTSGSGGAATNPATPAATEGTMTS